MKKLGIVLAGWLMAIGLAFGQVNINTANKEELDGLKGIGPTKAQAIVDFRKKNGPFKSVDDLQNVPGIGPATLKDLRSDVTVSGVSRPVAATPAPAAKKSEVAAPAMPKPAAPVSAPAKPAQPAPAAPAVATPAKPVPAAPGSAPESKAAAPASPVTAPAKPAMPSAAPAPAKPAAPAAPAKVPVEAKAAATTAPAAPAKPAQPAQPAKPAAN